MTIKKFLIRFIQVNFGYSFIGSIISVIISLICQYDCLSYLFFYIVAVILFDIEPAELHGDNNPFAFDIKSRI